MKDTPRRFEMIHEDKGPFEATRILRDRDTGVCYLFHWAGPAGGLTVLLDAEGRPVVEPVTAQQPD